MPVIARVGEDHVLVQIALGAQSGDVWSQLNTLAIQALQGEGRRLLKSCVRCAGRGLGVPAHA